jgi:hypothetical protein
VLGRRVEGEVDGVGVLVHCDVRLAVRVAQSGRVMLTGSVAQIGRVIAHMKVASVRDSQTCVVSGAREKLACAHDRPMRALQGRPGGMSWMTGGSSCTVDVGKPEVASCDLLARNATTRIGLAARQGHIRW